MKPNADRARSIEQSYLIGQFVTDHLIRLHRLFEGDHVTHMRPCNALSVSSATGIPRETVRRKVKWLEQKGWITVGERGELEITRGVSRQFSEFDRATADRFEASARQVLRVIDGSPRLA